MFSSGSYKPDNYFYEDLYKIPYESFFLYEFTGEEQHVAQPRIVFRKHRTIDEPWEPSASNL